MYVSKVNFQRITFPYFFSISALQHLNPSPDTMLGTATDDDIRGLNGNDIIDGLQGSDEIQANKAMTC